MAKIIDIEGIGEAFRDKLTAAGIATTDALLERGATPKGRETLAADTGISPKLILTWINHADLYRIKGIGSEYADLLEAAGVDTVPELAQRNPANLLQKLLDANEAKQLVRRPPALGQVEAWIAEAQTLPRIIEY